MASRAWLLVAAALAASASASVLPASRGRAARCWRPTPRSALPPARPARAMPPVAMMADKDNVEAKRVIMKFGGSSVRDAERVSEVCTLVQKRITELGIEPHLVCSAMGKTTNNLLAAAKKALEDKEVDLSAVRKLHSEAAEQLGVTGTEYYQQIVTLLDECERVLEGVALLGELSPRTNDLLVSFGERMSGRMVAARFNQIGVPAVQIESWDLGVITDSNFGDASVLDDSWPVIRTKLNAVPKGTVAVITGFIGKDKEGRITTLGRGGSDLTASLVGAAAGFDEVQVWKDVDGILTADPRACPNAKPVPYVTFEEAAELAYFGAQVLHPVAMQPAMRVDIPVRVKNSYNPEAKGTLITRTHQEPPLVSAITSKSGVTMVDITSTRMLGQYGFLSEVFKAFEKHKLSVDVIASSEVSVSLTLNKSLKPPRKVRGADMIAGSEQLAGMLNDLSKVAEVSVTTGHSIITLIADVSRSSSVMAIVFAVMAQLGVKVEMMSQGASKVNISIIVPDEKEREALQALHKCFFEDKCAVPAPAVELAAQGAGES